MIERFGYRTAAALSPVWRAWDWLTGLRSVVLAEVLFCLIYPVSSVREVRKGEWLWVALSLIGAVIVAKNLRVLLRHNPDAGDALPIEVGISRGRFAFVAGFMVGGTVVQVLLFTVSHNPYSTIESAAFTVACCAAAADKSGSGKHVFSRAADRLRASLPRLVAAPVAGS